jgi:hypothetical protein
MRGAQGADVSNLLVVLCSGHETQPAGPPCGIQ